MNRGYAAARTLTGFIRNTLSAFRTMNHSHNGERLSRLIQLVNIKIETKKPSNTGVTTTKDGIKYKLT